MSQRINRCLDVVLRLASTNVSKEIWPTNLKLANLWVLINVRNQIAITARNHLFTIQIRDFP